MRGNDKVIAQLNDALRAELVAINQYFLHAEMCENWGYHRLSEITKKQSFGEMKHAESVIERILFLEGTPGLGMKLPLKVGGNVKAQLENDLSLELEAVANYNAAIRMCTEEGDNTSRDLFQKLLADEEKHIDFLEAQLNVIKEIGLQNYLAQQMHDEGK
ncbi:MAG: bacterioferritin [Acidobacteria bacterium]|nr:bacterioferritin [Acidobacteriota bacterium]